METGTNRWTAHDAPTLGRAVLDLLRDDEPELRAAAEVVARHAEPGAVDPPYGPPYVVRWKDEGTSGTGVAIGPVTLIVVPVYEEWKRENGIAPDALGVPYGSRPAGVVDLGWRTEEDARRIANAMGVGLTDDLGRTEEVAS